MTPYWAVITDSFRAALSSRILWVAFVAIWLLLASLAPIGFREDFTTTFRGQDFRNGTRMKAMLAQGLVDPESKQTAIGSIAREMPEDLRRQLMRVGEGDEVRIRLSVLADALNDLLDEPSWYDPELWQDMPRIKELRELDDMDESEISESLSRRRARLRIETAMPGVFESRASRSVFLTYAGMDFPADLAVDKTQFANLINQFVLPTIINWLLGFVLIFLGILVTASVVPDMLQPGSLHLLLSKPVSRSLLLLSKFIGGCAFVLLCVTQLVIGLYLIAGLRLDVWNLRLLWCIPVSVFLFSVFYSVSTLAGLRWRSPILAIGVTTIFGGICLVVGVVGRLFDGLVTRPDRLQHFAVSDSSAFASTRGGGLVRLSDEDDRWISVFDSGAVNQDRIVPPVVLDSSRVITAQVKGGRFNPFGSGALDLLVIGRDGDWTPEPSLRLPTATSWLYRIDDDRILAMNTNDLSVTQRAEILDAAGQKASSESDGDGEPSDAPESDETASAKAGDGGGWLSKLTNMMGGTTSGFESILPSSVSIAPPRSLAIADDGGSLVLFSRGRVVRLSSDTQENEGQAGAWSVAADRTLDGEPSRSGVIAIAGDRILIAREEESIEVLDAETLESVASLSWPEGVNIPVAAVGLSSRQAFVLLSGDGRIRAIEATDGEFTLGSPLGPDNVEAIGVDRSTSGASEIWVAHDIDEVDVLDAADFSTRRTIRPSLSRWRWIDAYVISPLRMVIPQTGELGETVAATVSGKSAFSIDNGGEDEELVRYKILRPVLSCAMFIVVMLSISCVYFSTRDF